MTDISLLIYKTLRVSTAHIPKHTDDALEQRSVSEGLCHTAAMDGWSFPAPAHNSELVKLRLQSHGELVKLLKLAAAHDCAYLVLDADAEMIEGLPVFDW